MSSSASDTRVRILDAALELVRKGVASASMRQIANAAGLSRQALYLHFSDRADLYVAMVRHVDDQGALEAELQKIEQAPTGKAALSEAIKLQTRINPHLYPVGASIDALRRQDPALQRAWDDRLAHRLQGAIAIAQRLQQEGALRPELDEQTVSDAIWTLLSLRTWEDLVVLRGWSKEKYVRGVGDLLARFLYRTPLAK